MVERRQLALQHEILAAASGEEWDEDYHRKMVDILNRGFTSEYYKTFQMIQPEMTSRECALVGDILEMFTTIERSYAEMAMGERDSLGERADHPLRFRGFDHNDALEGKLGSYAHHMIKVGRWTNLADRFDAGHEHGNSHVPVLAAYQRMLTVWKPLWVEKLRSYGGSNDYRFSVDELRSILDAWPYRKG